MLGMRRPCAWCAWARHGPRGRGGPVRTDRGARLDRGAPGRPSTARRRSGAARGDTLGVGGLWWRAVGSATGAASGGTGNGVGVADGWLLAGETPDFAAALPASRLSPTTVAAGAAAATDARGAAVSRVTGGRGDRSRLCQCGCSGRPGFPSRTEAADEVVHPRRTGSRPRWRPRQTRPRPNKRPQRRRRGVDRRGRGRG